MHVLSEKIRCLSLGDPILDGVYPGFEIGDFAVLHGDAISFMLFVLTVRCQLSVHEGGLNSTVVFVDGGNSFNPYIIAEIARSYDLDPRKTLENVYVSRAFTAYQFSTLILEKLEPFLKRKRSKLLVVSDISTLYFDKDMPKKEAGDLFTKVCMKLAEIASEKQTVVVTSHFQEKGSKFNMFFEPALFGRSTVLVGFKRRGKTLSFVLEDHPRVRPFSVTFHEDYTPLAALGEV